MVSKNLHLLEEPQAALYNWLRAANDQWRDQVSVGEHILVVDIGGGTTDLSLVRVDEDNGNLALERIAVGEHILLGGDNMDLALAFKIKTKMEAAGKALQLWQVQAISTACGEAKETLLGNNDVTEVPIRIPGRGSKLIGGTISSELTQQEVLDTLVDGFFPVVPVDALPAANRRSGLAQQGLPYAQDPAITKHLAAFLTRHGLPSEDSLNPLAPGTNDFIKPRAILFNGGVLKSHHLRERLLTVINQWLSSAGAPGVRELQGGDLDHGVAKGAGFAGFLAANGGLRIRAGLSHSYYVGIDSAMPAIPGMRASTAALCIAPFGMEEGTETPLTPKVFTLRVGEPVHFRFFSATNRQEDGFGELFEELPRELVELPEISLTLNASPTLTDPSVTVQLKAAISETGTLELLAEESNRENPEQWRIAFDTRQLAAESAA